MFLVLGEKTEVPSGWAHCSVIEAPADSCERFGVARLAVSTRILVKVKKSAL